MSERVCVREERDCCSCHMISGRLGATTRFAGRFGTDMNERKREKEKVLLGIMILNGGSRTAPGDLCLFYWYFM